MSVLSARIHGERALQIGQTVLRIDSAVMAVGETSRFNHLRRE